MSGTPKQSPAKLLLVHPLVLPALAVAVKVASTATGDCFGASSMGMLLRCGLCVVGVDFGICPNVMPGVRIPLAIPSYAIAI